jgi:lipopolysaccharide heptosyltransferase II
LKALLVRLRQIGDVVFTTPTFSALLDHFPGAQLTYLVEPAAAAVVAGNPRLADVIVVPRAKGIRGFTGDLALGRRLARERFDVAIDFHGGPRASLLTWLSRAPRRVGYEIAGRSWMYTDRVARPRELRARHSVENQWDLLAALGVPRPTRERYPVEMPVDPAAAARVESRLNAHDVHAAARLAVLHVSAGNPFRRWPIASFAEVAAELTAIDPALRVIVTAGPSEADAANRMIELARSRLAAEQQSHVLACGDFDLAELRALVERAAIYIGGDSGPMHVASTSRVPIVSLYGPTLPARSEPWRDSRLLSAAIETSGLPCRPCDQRSCAPGDFRCLGRISPETVAAAARRLLGEERLRLRAVSHP